MILKYLSLLRIGWLDALEYRTEVFVSFIGVVIRLAIALFLWYSVAGSREAMIGSYSFEKILAYFLMVQILSSFVFSRVGFDIAHDIYRGDFANFLMKPIHYLGFRLTHEMSKNLFRVAITLAALGILLIFLKEHYSLPLWKFPMFIASLIGGYMINFCIIAMIALSAFWVTNSTRFMFIYFGILNILSGLLFPLDLVPERFLKIVELNPITYTFYYPVALLQHPNISPELLRGFAIQWMYVALLLSCLLLVFSRGVRHFEAVGR